MLQSHQTACGMINDPALGEYCYTYAIYVDCRQCQKPATIGSIHGTDGYVIFKCNSCGWMDKPPLKYDELIAGIKKGISGK